MDYEATGSRDGPVSTRIQIQKNELFLLLKSEHFYKQSSVKCNERLISYILDKLSVAELPADFETELKTVVKLFVSKLLIKWKNCNYTYNRFEKKHQEWLKGDLNLPQMCPSTSRTFLSKIGRPKKLFSDSCERTKQRDIKQIVSSISPEKLCYATESTLVKSGKRTAAQVVKLALTTSPRTLKKMKQVPNSSSTTNKPYTPEEALALIVDLGLGKEEYITIQRGAKARGANIYPSYNVIADLKKQCYPPNMTITETEALTPLQNLLDLTIQRLVKVQFEVLMQNIPNQVTDIDVIYKWGLDGSGGHSIYKQNFLSNSHYGDSNIILCTIVPLKLSVQTSDKQIYWKNLSPSSTKYCRPIGFKLKKETNQTMKEEYQLIQDQVDQLQPTKIWIADKELSFKHIPVCTMLDGKTCNILTDTASSQTCNVCKVTPRDINNLLKIKERPSDTTTFKFGISILHAYLRSYEYLLHIAYKLETQEWQARGAEAKEVVKQRKNMTCSLFYEKMGLVVDQPKQGGGNSNDGNTARKFFDNPHLVSQITGLDEDLISRFANILIAISSGHYIDTQKFGFYCFETAEMCVNLYGWYKMSASVHKLLIHGSEIINSLPLPVGQFSEDVLEAGHKDYKNLRLFNSRKTSRIDTNTDILHWMLVSSDPIISSYRKKSKKRRKPFSEDVKKMLKIPDFLQVNSIELDRADDIEGDIVDDEMGDVIDNGDIMVGVNHNDDFRGNVTDNDE